MSSIIRTALTQARADLRAVFFSPAVIGVLLGPAFILGWAYYLSDRVSDNMPLSVGGFMLVSTIGVFSTMIVMQLSSEMSSERLDGTLLRVRTLPHGALSWAIGKTLSNVVLQAILQTVIMVGAFLLLPPLGISGSQWLVTIGLVLFTICATAPLGFMVGALVRGVYSQMFLFFGTMIVVATSGAFFPITILPTWLQYLHMPLPFYWAGHLSRWVLLGADGASYDFAGGSQPLLAAGILLAWMIGGFALATWSINRSFRKLSLSSLASMQSAMRSQLGV